MNEKGQAYSTFKLLIAAIVAMAILAILIPIIMNVMGLITADPTAETKSILSSLIDSPGSMRMTKEVSFSQGTDLSGSALAERVSISQDQICMSTGDFLEGDDEDFTCLNCDDSGANQHRLIYNGTADRVARVAIVCNRWSDTGGLADDLDDYGLEDGDSIQGNSITDACEICQEGSKCCALVLKRA